MLQEIQSAGAAWKLLLDDLEDHPSREVVAAW
jgi:hypothetical protein